METFSNEFNIPVEITILVFSHLSIPYLHKTLGCTLDHLVVYVRKIGYEKFWSQLMEIGGYQILDDGSKKTIYKLDVSLV